VLVTGNRVPTAVYQQLRAARDTLIDTTANALQRLAVDHRAISASGCMPLPMRS